MAELYNPDDAVTEEIDPTAEVAPPSGTSAVVLALRGTAMGQLFRLPPGVALIGRSKTCAVTLDDEGVSRIHAAIHSTSAADGPSYELEDRGSRNGTWINGERVHGRVPLHDGDRLLLGRTTVLKFTRQDTIEEMFHVRMVESALRDALTRLFNRRYFLERFDSELRFARRHNTGLALLLFDVDHFKAINDTHGHGVGDEVLAQIATLLSRSIRTEDVLARYGGEEFVLALRAVPAQEALALADRLRAMVEAHHVQIGAARITATVSVGVATYPELSVVQAADLIEAADRALYRAKGAGRNRVAT